MKGKKNENIVVTTYRGYTLECDMSAKGVSIPTYVREINHTFDDVAKAKRYIDTSFGEFYSF